MKIKEQRAVISSNKELLNGIELPSELAGKEVIATYQGDGIFICFTDNPNDNGGWRVPIELLKFNEPKQSIDDEDHILSTCGNLFAYSFVFGVVIGAAVSFLIYKIV